MSLWGGDGESVEGMDGICGEMSESVEVIGESVEVIYESTEMMSP